MTIRVLIADDEDLVRGGLQAIVESEPEMTVVAQANTGARVPGLVRQHRPDVVLMDVRMPEMDGIEATRYVTSKMDNPPKIIVVTTFENDDYVYEALRAGAAGFFLKRTKPDEMIAAIRLVASGDSLLFPAAIRAMASVRSPKFAEFYLTEREGEVLRLMAKGMSNTEIASALFVGHETVKTHVGNILTKLNVRDRTQAVIAAYESGFINPMQ
ncbi:MAG: response regulator transcription factor [Corynebacteriales bacterium]|nr:response regulator transcription factor [Mycobacteriales bacterium]